MKSKVVMDSITKKGYAFDDEVKYRSFNAMCKEIEDRLTEHDYYQYISLWLKAYGTEV